MEVFIMKISTKGRYGVKAMLDLALHSDGNPVALKSIAERQGISESYLEQLIAILKKNGLVNSIRGAQGGYLLAHDPKDIIVGDIIRALEGSLAPADCVIEEDPAPCSKADGCVTRVLWEKIRDSVNDVIDSVTLQDMIDGYYKKSNTNMYCV